MQSKGYLNKDSISLFINQYQDPASRAKMIAVLSRRLDYQIRANQNRAQMKFVVNLNMLKDEIIRDSRY